jgi:hypothetical protein
MKQFLFFLISIYTIQSFGQIALNEVQSSNNSTIADDAGDFDDWIELYNPTIDSIEIGGLVLKDQLDTWAIPIGDPATHIPPGGYFLLWADDQEEQGIFHTNFKLASGGEFLGLYESDGTTVIDTITIPPLNANDSYVKCDSVWFTTNAPTPLADNNCTLGIIESKKSNDFYRVVQLNTGQLEIMINDSFEAKVTLKIYSITGQELLSQTISNQQTLVNTSGLESGGYIIVLSNERFQYSKKIALN